MALALPYVLNTLSGTALGYIGMATNAPGKS